MWPCPEEAGMPNELITVGKALGHLRLRGVQYMQIRVIVIAIIMEFLLEKLFRSRQ